MKNSFSLLFYLKKRSTQENCALPIYLRITVDGQRAEAATGRKCDPPRWNTGAGRGIGMKEDTRTLNAYLDGLQAKAYQAQKGLNLKA
ncbi:MAG TPA: Arm DNA-binding domain-containing protein [Anseongella sp.]